MWIVPHAFVGTRAKNQTSSRDHVYSVPHREGGLLTGSETWAEPMAVRPLEGARYEAKCANERTRFLLAQVAK